MGWPAALDLAFFALVAALFALPTLILPVPLDTDAQGFGYLALMTRLGGSLDTLAPFHPEISYLYAPGFPLLVAWLSSQLGQPLHQVQFALAAVLGLLNVWLAHDLGSELGGRRLGRAVALALTGGLGLFLAYMDSHFTTLLAVVFAQGFVLCALRYQRDGQRADLFAAALLLAAVVLSHPDTSIILALGFGPWLITMWSGEPRPSLRRWLLLLAGVPLLALFIISPWLLRSLPLLGGDIVSPFARDPGHALVMLGFHGLWSWPLALLGARMGLRRRDQATLLALGWLLFCADFAFLGISERIAPWLPLFRYDYPFSIAWHGPLIPLSLLAGQGLLRLWQWLAPRWPEQQWRRAAWSLLTAGFALAALALVLQPQLLALSKGHFSFHGAYASHADVAAMTWLRENSPEKARVLNFPGSAVDSSWGRRLGRGDQRARQRLLSLATILPWQRGQRGRARAPSQFLAGPGQAGACATAVRGRHRLCARAADRGGAGELRRSMALARTRRLVAAHGLDGGGRILADAGVRAGWRAGLRRQRGR